MIVERPATTAASRGVSVDDIEVQLLLEGIVQRSGYDFRGYDPSVVKRRVERMLASEGLPTISELQGRALRDDACLSRLLTALTFRHLSMFADASLFRDLRATVVPLLRTYPFVRIWNAGCSTGEDAYALAIVLDEAGLYDRCRIYATDAAAELVDAAQHGTYDAETLYEWQRGHAAGGGTRDLDAYMRVEKRLLRIDPALRRNIVFAQHNLVTDGSFNEFHLIFCPGLVRQYGKELQSRVHIALYDSLIRLGFLALARDESIVTSPAAKAYRKVDVDSSIFRRAV